MKWISNGIISSLTAIIPRPCKPRVKIADESFFHLVEHKRGNVTSQSGAESQPKTAQILTQDQFWAHLSVELLTVFM